MSIVAPKGRKHLSADALFRLVHSGFANLPDYRVGDVEIALPDALMSAFAMFSLKAPSLLAFDKERAEGHLHTIDGMTRVPCDTHMREILDPVSPKLLRPMFTSLFRQLQRGKALAAMTFLRWPLFGGARWPGLFLLQDDSLCVVSPPGPPQWVDHLYPSDVGGGDYASRRAGRDPLDA